MVKRVREGGGEGARVRLKPPPFLGFFFFLIPIQTSPQSRQTRRHGSRTGGLSLESPDSRSHPGPCFLNPKLVFKFSWRGNCFNLTNILAFSCSLHSGLQTSAAPRCFSGGETREVNGDLRITDNSVLLNQRQSE